MPVSYTLVIDLAQVSGQLGKYELEFDNFAAVMNARDKIMARMVIRPKLSDPAGRIEAQTEGET